VAKGKNTRCKLSEDDLALIRIKPGCRRRLLSPMAVGQSHKSATGVASYRSNFKTLSANASVQFLFSGLGDYLVPTHVKQVSLSVMEKKMIRIFCAFVLVVVGGSVACGDGLIWQLPPDGTTVGFQGECEGEFKPVLSKDFADKMPSQEVEKLEQPQKIKMKIGVTVSSVGQTTRAEQKCRWIEIALRSDDTENILKILVPEKYLARGEDPLDHAILTFYNPKDMDRAKVTLEEGFNRIQYELDRCRSAFPMPLKDVHKLPKKTIETPIGTFKDCEVIEGSMEFDRPLCAKGRWEIKSSWKIALHPDAPFGVVQVQCQSTGHEYSRNTRCDISTTSTLTISGKGGNAKSKLAGDSGKEADGSE
jgi:hypothetical protein